VPGDKPKLLKIASRGFSPNKNATEIAQDFADALDQDLFVNVPERWREGIDTFSFDDQTYLGLGRERRLAQDMGIYRILEELSAPDEFEHDEREAPSRS
jgi:hypothetical protein